MAVGIRSIGVHIPWFRLGRDTVAQAWGGRGGKGARAVANYDEDTVTMSVSAARNALEGVEGGVDAVYSASTTAPVAESQISTLVAAVADQARTTATADFGGSLRSGVAALLAAADAVAGGARRRALVTAADHRVGAPGSDFEGTLGDAAAAAVLASEDVIATLDGRYTVSEPFQDTWRLGREPFVEKGDDAFSIPFGFDRLGREAAKNLLTALNLSLQDFAYVAVSAPNARALKALAGGLKVGADQLVGADLLDQVGDTGAAGPLLVLAAALERATPGDRILLLSYGSGTADALAFTATDVLPRQPRRRGVAYHLEHQHPLSSYARFLVFNGSLPSDQDINPFTSAPMEWREYRQNLQLYGVRCKKCGTFYFPQRRVCLKCHARDEMELERMGREGKVFSFERSHTAPTDNPPLVMAVTDLVGDGRFYGQMTDVDPAEVRTGLPVELVFRKLHQGGGYPHYFWKIKPQRG